MSERIWQWQTVAVSIGGANVRPKRKDTQTEFSNKRHVANDNTDTHLQMLAYLVQRRHKQKDKVNTVDRKDRWLSAADLSNP